MQSSVVNLCATIIGAGMLGLPICIANTGIILGIIILVLGAWICGLFYRAIIKASIETEKYTYIEITEKLYGSLAKKVLEIVLFLHPLGVITAY